MAAPLIHLDTNYLIHFVNGSNLNVIERVEDWLRGGSKIYISAMTWAEFQCGPLSESTHSVALEVLHGVVPLTAELGSKAGSLFRATGRRSKSLADCIIAATAISEDAPLATLNRGDFEPFLRHGLALI